MNKLQHTSAPIIILATALLFVTSSCYTKKYCADNWFWVELHGYTATELDTVFFCQYLRNTNYSVLTGSTRLEVDQISGADYFLLPVEALDPAFDYKINVTSIGRFYNISDITTKKEFCNSYLSIVPKDKYAKIISFQLDGKTITGQRAELYK